MASAEWDAPGTVCVDASMSAKFFLSGTCGRIDSLERLVLFLLNQPLARMVRAHDYSGPMMLTHHIEDPSVLEGQVSPFVCGGPALSGDNGLPRIGSLRLMIDDDDFDDETGDLDDFDEDGLDDFDELDEDEEVDAEEDDFDDFDGFEDLDDFGDDEF